MKAVGVMAPAVKQTLKSRVNPDMHFDGVRDLPSPRWYRRHASDFFEKVFLPDVDLHLIGSNQACLCLESASLPCRAVSRCRH